MGNVNKPLMLAGGVSRMASSLRRLGDEELSKEMKAVSKAAAQKIVPFAKMQVPVGPTGRLRDTIKADATRRYGRIKAGTPGRVPYARWVHRGGYFPWSGTRTKATPFLTIAIRKAYPYISDDYIKGMNKIAKKFAAKHGGHRAVGGFKKHD